jgi:NAD-dependent SIR2 family protein deacetylase
MNSFEQRLNALHQALDQAEAVLIGAGAGLSAAAGLTYSGARFHNNFAEFIAKYGMQDMYSAGFYPFPSEEAKWAYWARHATVNRHQPPASALYQRLHVLVADKPHFVLTTNVDGQFYKAGFVEERVFATQGDYGKLQCAIPCHDGLYDNQSMMAQMEQAQQACLIPCELVPACPRCGGPMQMHLRIDQRFVENGDWHRAANAYQSFVAKALDKKLLLLELGVGYNTPGIIKYPFEQFAAQAKDATLVRINRDYPEVSDSNRQRTLVFAEDMERVLDGVGSLV